MGDNKRIDNNSLNSYSEDNEDHLYINIQVINTKNVDKEYKTKKKNKIFIHIINQNKKNISLETIKKFFDDKDYHNLKEYQFPYIKLSKFCSIIHQAKIQRFRQLIFIVLYAIEILDNIQFHTIFSSSILQKLTNF